MPHSIVPEAEKILDKPYKVLDKGFLRLVDYMGGDERIVAAARVSYGSGTRTFREDRGLIDYLLRNDHTSPFEQVVFTFHAKLPIFVARQWIRHRTARLNEISGRYSVMKDEFYVPAARDISFQSADNKQGRSTEKVPVKVQKQVLAILKSGYKRSYDDYKKILDKDIARELARVSLPLSLYTEWYWQIDLHNLFHFLALRLDPHAQMEIRAYAEVMHSLARTVCPVAFESFDNHIRSSVRLSSGETAAVRDLLSGKQTTLDERGKRILGGKLGMEL